MALYFCALTVLGINKFTTSSVCIKALKIYVRKASIAWLVSYSSSSKFVTCYSRRCMYIFRRALLLCEATLFLALADS